MMKSIFNTGFIIKIIRINILIIIGLFLAIEGGSYTILKILESSGNKSISKQKETNSNIVSTWNFTFDPAVGYVHKEEDYRKSPNSIKSTANTNLFTIKSYGKGETEFSILILGGSSSDALGTQFSGLEGTWADQIGTPLSFKLKKRISIMNAATGGNTSSQELIRLIASMQFRIPKVVISLNGINEYYFEDSLPLRDDRNVYASRMIVEALNRTHIRIPYKNTKICTYTCVTYHMYFNKLLSKLKHKNRLKAYQKNTALTADGEFKDTLLYKEGKYSLTEDKLRLIERASKIWYQNVMSMNALSVARGVKYFVFLQPTYGLDMTTEEILSIKGDRESEARVQLFRNNYLNRINSLYKKLRTKCSTLSFCIDISRDKNLNHNYKYYADPRHLNKSGNKILANKMLEALTPLIDRNEYYKSQID